MRLRFAVFLAVMITSPIPVRSQEQQQETQCADAQQSNAHDVSPQATNGANDDERRREAIRAMLLELGRLQGALDRPTEVRLLSGATPRYSRPLRRRLLVAARPVSRDETLQQRAALRAYDGAPPVMPHSRNFIKTKSCLDCHAEGIHLGDRVGPPLSHPHLINCMQCHVERQNLELHPAPPIENAFRGAEAPAGSERPWTHAPPVMPHTTFMRTDCLSCHASEAYPGLAIDHPERGSCLQCHAPAASLDQTSPFFSGGATLLRQPEDKAEPASTEPHD